MELGELEHAVRVDLDDVIPPYLYPTADIWRWCNNAVREAALRTRLLQDDSSPECTIQLVPGTSRYRLDPAILVVRAVHVPGRSRSLCLTNAQRLDKLEPGWVTNERQDTPRYAMFDVGQKTIALYPTPAVGGAMHLRVWRGPFERELMEDSSDEPVLMLPDPEELKHWVLWEAYSQKDSERSDPERATTHYQHFEARFGPRPTAHELALWSQDRIVGTRGDRDF